MRSYMICTQKKYEEDFAAPETGVHFHIFTTNFPEYHNHDYWEFCIVTSGKMTNMIEVNSELIAQPMNAQMACLIHPWDKHKIVQASENYQLLNVMITDELFRKCSTLIDSNLYDTVSAVKHPILYEIDKDSLNDFLKTVHTIQSLNNNHYNKSTTLLRLMWFDIFKIIIRNDSHTNADHPEWLNSFILKLRQPENISKPISELCSLTYFSYSHLTRLFKQFMGMTLQQYLHFLRLDYAAMLLKTTDMSILRISSTIGYDSLSHFTRTFKQAFGSTPSLYRKSIYQTLKKGNK